MSRTVRVYCKDCDGGTQADGYGCSVCNAQGHLDVDPEAVEREGFRLWVDALLPDVPPHPLRPTTGLPCE